MAYAFIYVLDLLGGLKSAVRSVLREERAQDALEYFMVTGVITVALLIALAAFIGADFAGIFVDGVCTAVGTVMPLGLGDCTP